jgi:hypothetical protein
MEGTPALVLAHDMRTRELSEIFGMPYLLIDREYSFEELIEILSAVDYSAFRQRIIHMQVEWKLFLQRNGIDFKLADNR